MKGSVIDNSLTDFDIHKILETQLTPGDFLLNNADLEDLNKDLLSAPNIMDHNINQIPSTNTEGNSREMFRRAGTLLTPKFVKQYTAKILAESYKLMGQGSPTNLLQNFLSRLDRHGTAIVPLNQLNYGFTFITRPRLNLSTANIRMHPVLSTLYGDFENTQGYNNSVPFMIRMLLDSRLCAGKYFKGMGKDSPAKAETDLAFNAVLKSGLLDPQNPFLTPLCNGLKGISGFPDFTIREETTEGDYHSGDFTFVKGADMNNNTNELSLEFRDVQGSVILSIIYIWLLYMALQAKGIVVAYPDDIYEQRLNYTVSIYRFVMDPSRKNILWWAKATGCFPKSVPVGALFNVNQGEVTLSSAMNFSIPFVANDVKYQDPAILTDFNRLIDKYTNNQIRIANAASNKQNAAFKTLTSKSANSNFNAIPYIETDRGGPMLVWKSNNWLFKDTMPTSNNDMSSASWTEVMQSMEEERAAQEEALMRSTELGTQITKANSQDADNLTAEKR